MKTREQIEAECQEPIPLSVVRQRQGGGGISLDYLTGEYVIDRLCQVFGPLGYDVTLPQSPTCVAQYEDKKQKQRTAYVATTRITVRFAEGECCKEDGGYGSGIDYDLGSAHESAYKEALTDSLKRAARLLGRSLGLDLYHRTYRVLALCAAGDVRKATQVAKDLRAAGERSSSPLTPAEIDLMSHAIKSAQAYRQGRGDTAMEKVAEKAEAAE